MRSLPILHVALACAACTPRPPATAETVAPPSPALSSAHTDAALKTRDALRQFLSHELGNWVVELNRSRSKARAPVLPTSLPPAVAKGFRRVFREARSLASLPPPDSKDVPKPIAAEARAPAATLDSAIAELNETLYQAALRFSLDAVAIEGDDENSPPTALLFAFELEEIRAYQLANGQRLEAAWARRIDDLAFRYRYLGFTAASDRPLILLDNIDAQLSSQLFDRPSQSVLAAAAKIAGPGAKRLAAALAARMELFETWNERHSEGGVVFRVPRTLAMPTEWHKQIASVVPPSELAKLDAIESDLAKTEMVSAYATLHRALAVAIELHELQHVLDRRAQRHAPAGLELSEEMRGGVGKEISAVLAELGRAPKTSRLSLDRLRAVARRETIEGLATRAALTALASSQASLDASDFTRADAILSELSDLELAQRAQATWRSLFGEPLATMSLVR